MHLEPGSHLGPYEITGALGAGGMGEVYRAHDPRLGREVAIKVLPPDFSRDERRIARFEREARSASALNHRNIITIHDFGTADGQTWLVMELVRGESLREVLSHGALPMKKLLTIAGGIADGLAAAHAAGIIHRDLKPENVMVTTDGTPKILDFGLVKHVMSNDTNSPTDMHISSSGVVMGTAGYMSPEQARGEVVDFRTDQFSFGLMLHEMATGQHPFRRSTGIDTLSAILNDEPAPLDDSFPDAFVAIVERCLAKNPAERYGSTLDLAHDLARVRDGSDRQAVREIHRKRAWPLMVFVAVTIALLAAVLALVIGRRTTEPVAESYRTSVATPEVALVVRDEVTQPVAISPDGRRLLVYGYDKDAIPTLSLHDLRTGSTRQLVQNTLSAGWSPDGTTIAYFADGKLKTMSADGGPSRIICDARPEGTPVWMGSSILYVQYSIADRGIYRVDAAGGKPVRVAAPNKAHPSLPWWPEPLPDAKHFLYLTLVQPVGADRSVEHELHIGSIDGSPEKVVAATIDSRAVYANGQLLFIRDGTLVAQPFDPDAARMTGEARPLVDGIHYFRSTGLAAFSVSNNGILAWRTALRPSRLAWLDRTGAETGFITTAPFTADGRLSPDGRRYAVGVVDPKQAVSDIWIYDLDRNSSERVTFSILDEKEPVWAPDGRTIYYRSDGGGGPPDIFRWSPEVEKGAVFYRGPGVEEPHDVSADGKWMLFIDYRQTTAADILVLPLNPLGPARPFVATPFNEFSPRFSPDGKWVAYQSDVSGRPEIYVRPFEGSGQTTRVSTDGGTRPRWAHSGKELFYLGPGGRLTSAPFANGALTGSPRALFQAPNLIDYDPANDDSRFIVQLEEHATEPSVELMTNWPSQLRSRN